MLFNSIDFAVFLPVVFVLYWFVTQRNLKLQNVLIVVASYVFYGWWDWRFLFLMLFSTLVDYLVGYALSSEENIKKRKVLLWISIIVNLGFLGFFKYFNFFIDNFIGAFSFLGMPIKANTLDIILPVGISFYTFQTLSYSIDVYKRKLEPTKDFIVFSAFVSFFPQLVAGPIERATNLLPQFYRKRKFVYEVAVDGLRQILWGLFKKIVIADNCAQYANLIFNNYQDYNGSTLALGAVFFAFQIYGDFSGYSDIAIGTSKLFGFNLMQNFAYPYFSRDIAEFWRRWHISLSTWFRDYLYIPLGGSKGGTLMKVRNTFIIFIVSGFWHGANWTFIVWGALNAVYFLPLLLANKNRFNIGIVAENSLLPSIKEFLQILLTFSLTCIAWVFFRSDNLVDSMLYLKTIFSSSLFHLPSIEKGLMNAFPTLCFLIILIFMDWKGRRELYPFSIVKNNNKIVQWLILLFLAILILENVYTGASQEFIYFDF